MKDEIKEILDKLNNESNYSNFITSQYGGPDYYYLLEKGEGKILLDYITNLQEENKKLKEDNYELQKYINEEEGFVKDENRELGLRIDKAIEYILSGRYGEEDDYESISLYMSKLLNILQGEDKDE